MVKPNKHKQKQSAKYQKTHAEAKAVADARHASRRKDGQASQGQSKDKAAGTTKSSESTSTSGKTRRGRNIAPQVERDFDFSALSAQEGQETRVEFSRLVGQDTGVSGSSGVTGVPGTTLSSAFQIEMYQHVLEPQLTLDTTHIAAATACIPLQQVLGCDVGLLSGNFVKALNSKATQHQSVSLPASIPMSMQATAGREVAATEGVASHASDSDNAVPLEAVLPETESVPSINVPDKVPCTKAEALPPSRECKGVKVTDKDSEGDEDEEDLEDWLDSVL
eukprot:m.64698 g.64698  ORF g.64698 m.64698 type:complete len:279 (-) comp12023_c0_seq2:73-909(-)